MRSPGQTQMGVTWPPSPTSDSTQRWWRKPTCKNSPDLWNNCMVQAHTLAMEYSFPTLHPFCAVLMCVCCDGGRSKRWDLSPASTAICPKRGACFAKGRRQTRECKIALEPQRVTLFDYLCISSAIIPFQVDYYWDGGVAAQWVLSIQCKHAFKITAWSMSSNIT